MRCRDTASPGTAPPRGVRPDGNGEPISTPVSCVAPDAVGRGVIPRGAPGPRWRAATAAVAEAAVAAAALANTACGSGDASMLDKPPRSWSSAYTVPSIGFVRSLSMGLCAVAAMPCVAAALPCATTVSCAGAGPFATTVPCAGAGPCANTAAADAAAGTGACQPPGAPDVATGRSCTPNANAPAALSASTASPSPPPLLPSRSPLLPPACAPAAAARMSGPSANEFAWLSITGCDVTGCDATGCDTGAATCSGSANDAWWLRGTGCECTTAAALPASGSPRRGCAVPRTCSASMSMCCSRRASALPMSPG
eukprot:364270-Chlamydomonas_euryale.AAC.2